MLRSLQKQNIRLHLHTEKEFESEVYEIWIHTGTFVYYEEDVNVSWSATYIASHKS